MKTLTIYEAKDGARFDTQEDCDRHERLDQRMAYALQHHEWNLTSESLAPEGEELLTKIHDDKGSRNQTTLKRQGNLWFYPSGSMYVYYTPTHWMKLPA